MGGSRRGGGACVWWEGQGAGIRAWTGAGAKTGGGDRGGDRGRRQGAATGMLVCGGGE